MFYLRRWNSSFEVPEYAATNGVDYTLHLDKAQRFATFEEACKALTWFFGASVCETDEVRRIEAMVAARV